MITRRSVSLAGGIALLAVPGIVFPQSTGRTFRIGVLGLGTGALDFKNPIWAAFIDELRKRGYEEGRNLAIDFRLAVKDSQGLDSLAVELVALKVDVIFTVGGTPSVQAAKKATTTIPIVMLSAADPVRDGLISGLAHPGGNVTGNAILGSELVVKRLQLLSEAVGKPKRIAYLTARDATSLPHSDDYQAALAAAARSVGAELQPQLVDSSDDLESAFENMARQRVDALVLDNPVIFYVNLRRVADLIARYRVPAIADARAFAEAGLLMAYGLNYPNLARSAAGYIDRILKGASPRDLPVEQATKFVMIVNLKTAKALGITIPRAVLLRADQVIE